jgi:hypothetical protein
MDAAELIEQYVELRDHLNVERKKFKELEANIKSDLNVIEASILELQDKIGSTSISSDRGTAFRVTKEYYRMGDWDKFIKYVTDTGNFQMLEKRVAKIATKEVLADDESLTPDMIGVDYSREFTVQIRRK